MLVIEQPPLSPIKMVPSIEGDFEFCHHLRFCRYYG